MEDSSSTASNVARAILAVLDYSSTSDTRKAAVEFLESIKSGDVRVLANTSFLLVKKEWSPEIRLHAFKMLQHLVRLRWDELSPPECRDLVNVSVGLMTEVANACENWSLKSQSAALVAEIVRREGPNLWQEIFTLLTSLSAQGPLQDVAVVDSQQLALDCIIATIFDGSTEVAGESSEVHYALGGIYEGLLQQLLSLKWNEPELIKVQVHYLDAPDAVGSVINKLFGLLTSLPHAVKDPATSTSRAARLQICTSFIRVAKAAEKSVLPHMKLFKTQI